MNTAALLAPVAKRHRAYAQSVARRMLHGSGTGSFVAYRDHQHHAVDVVAHGQTEAGTLMIAALWPSDRFVQMSQDIRLDIRREAPEPAVRIIAASLHVLGRVEWLPPETGADCAGYDFLPRHLSNVATAPNVRIGVVHIERAVLHDGSGAVPFSLHELMAPRSAEAIVPSRGHEFDTHQLVATFGEECLLALIDAVNAGRLLGAVLSMRAVEPTEDLATVFVIDVDSEGIQLLHITDGIARTVLACFDGAARNLTELYDRVHTLCAVTQS